MRMTTVVHTIPSVFFAVGFISASFIVIKYNVKTYKLQRRVRCIAEAHGEKWEMWGNFDQMISYVTRPLDLIGNSSSQEVIAAKQLLLAHRRTVAPTAIKAGACFAFGIISSAISAILLGVS